MKTMKKYIDYFNEYWEGEEEMFMSVVSVADPFYLALARGCKELEVTQKEFVLLMSYFHPGSNGWEGKIYGIMLKVI